MILTFTPESYRHNLHGPVNRHVFVRLHIMQALMNVSYGLTQIDDRCLLPHGVVVDCCMPIDPIWIHHPISPNFLPIIGRSPHTVQHPPKSQCGFNTMHMFLLYQCLHAIVTQKSGISVCIQWTGVRIEFVSLYHPCANLSHWSRFCDLTSLPFPIFMLLYRVWWVESWFQLKPPRIYYSVQCMFCL